MPGHLAENVLKRIRVLLTETRVSLQYSTFTTPSSRAKVYKLCTNTTFIVYQLSIFHVSSSSNVEGN
jgi:hypothetical protein